MLQFVTVATTSYYPEAARLARSLLRTQGAHRLRLYCEDDSVFRHLARETGCELVPFPSMTQVGGFRVKPLIWAHALQEGGFLFLDADIIALEPLDRPFSTVQLSASPDSAPRALRWPARPWPGLPELHCRIYVNTGVLHFPVSAKPLLEAMQELALDRERWNRHVIRFNDQDVFNALLNLRQQPVDLLDPKTWNLEGFLTGKVMNHWQQGHRGPVPRELLQAERVGSHLCNVDSGAVLKLVHLAGIPDRTAFIGLLPPEIRELLELRAH